MDRRQFLTQLFTMYPKAFDQANATLWQKAYEEVIPLTADFDDLMHKVYSEYTGTTIPKPAWFADKWKIDKKDGYFYDNKLRFQTLKVRIGDNREYEFWYNPQIETKEQAQKAILERFKNGEKVIFIDTKPKLSEI